MEPEPKGPYPMTLETTTRGGCPDPSDSAIDEVEEASEESFPASDAPSHTPVTSLGPPHVDEHGHVIPKSGGKPPESP